LKCIAQIEILLYLRRQKLYFMYKIGFFSALLDMIVPRRCACCGQRLLPMEDELCISCVLSLGRTYFWRNPYDNAMVRRISLLFDVEKAASWFFYRGDKARSTLWSLKYYGRDGVGRECGVVMANEMIGSGFFNDIDVIVPMPLARNRLRQRGYSQSLRLAQGISDVTHIPIVTNAIKRSKFKQSQTSLSHWARRENVAGQFSLANSTELQGKHVLVIDDVVTTGSTVAECVAPILQIEGIKISVLSLAFTV